MAVTKQMLIDVFRNLGVTPGMDMVVHSSLKSLGHVDGGADTVIDALLDTVGPKGTILMPVMTFSTVFNADTSTSETGLIGETMRKRPNAIRSLSPTHSTTGIGPKAKSLLDGHDAEIPYGPNGFGSPLDKLAKGGGYVMLLGVSHVSNTTSHLILYHADIPFLEQWRDVEVTSADGATRTVKARHAGCSDGFERLDPALVDAGVQSSLKIGKAEVRLMKGQDLLGVGLKAMRNNPALMLCGNYACEFCGYAASELNV